MPGYGAYITRDEKWIYLLILTDSHWEKFCEALQLPLVATQQFGTLRERKKGREAVEEMVRDAVRCTDFDDAMQKLKTAGVGATEVLPLERVLEAPQARQPGKLRAIKFRDLDFEIPEFPQNNSDKNSLQTLAPAEIGQHTREILRELGIDDHHCEALIASGAVVDSTHGSFSWAPVRK
jgi:crotonobetainyl-CoA:carnitine CoA-transferase CaiB-like acyl-CoA transferase